MMGEHRDATWITILTEVGPGALEVRRRDDGAREAGYIPADGAGETFIVNTGRALEEFSDRFFRATCHRVVARADNPQVRVSMPFFYDANDGVGRTQGGCGEQDEEKGGNGGGGGGGEGGGGEGKQ